MKEKWKNIPGFYHGYYQVSSLGRVRSLTRTFIHPHFGKITRKGKIRKLTINQNGYYFLILSANGVKKNCLVHRLVAEVFVKNPFPNKFKIINHIDSDTKNNIAYNLMWCNQSINIQHAFDSGRKKSPKYWKGKTGKNNPKSKTVHKYDLQGNYICSYESVTKAQLKNKTKNISSVCNGVRNKAGGFIWSYIKTDKLKYHL